ncbi:MAG: hypothetical protein PUD14_07420 [Prevotellaceae bacterium]|nr:hypothetical protein [Prevotellaceae bacterium]
MKKKEYVRPQIVVFDMDIKPTILAGSGIMQADDYSVIDGDQITE